MPKDFDELDKSLVSISEKTDLSETVREEVLHALRLVPPKLKSKLSDIGVRIVLTPTIAKVVPNFDDLASSFGVDRATIEEYARGWPVLYSPVTKTIYIGESWASYTGNSITYNVLNRCAFALQSDKDFINIRELCNAIKSDFDTVPGDLMSPNISDPKEFYSSIFAVVIMSTSDQDFGTWPKGMAMMYPNTTKFVRSNLNEYR